MPAPALNQEETTEVAAPDYVPVILDDKTRAGSRLPPPRRWTATRPADIVGRQPVGALMGRPGPDQGYALRLLRLFEDRIVLRPGEHRDDALAGCLGVALARASLFGRAPIVHDLDLAFSLWGFLGDAPVELVDFRKPLFAGAAHHYWDQRAIVDRVPESTLRLTPAPVRSRLSDWRTLLIL